MTGHLPAAAGGWMLLSMSCIAIVDGMAKHLARELSGVQVAWGYFLATFLALLAYAVATRVPCFVLTRMLRSTERPPSTRI